MRKTLLSIGLATALGLGASVAVAGPVWNLPSGSPLYIKFDNREQIATNGANTGYANEINWGVVVITNVNLGQVTGVNTIESIGAPLFTNGVTNNGQITGIFYGIESAPADPLSAFPATSGFLDLYWRDLDTYSFTNLPGSAPTVRTSQSTASGFTDGTLLVHLAFASGITNTATTFISGNTIPTSQGFAGLATSFANVDLSQVGPWSGTLNRDWFTTQFGSRDFRFRNIYENLAEWNGAGCESPTAPCVLGARSTDPATAFTVPEPASLALLGLGLLGVFGFNSRRNKA